MTQNELFPAPASSVIKPGSQAAMILDHMRGGRSITALEASRIYGVGRLAAVVFNLKEAGYQVATDMVSVEKAGGRGSARVASYRLASSAGPVGDPS